MQTSGPAYPIESVDRALQLLVMLKDGDRLSVKEAAKRLDVAPSTAHRLFAALSHRGFAAQQQDRSYCVGPVLITETAHLLDADLSRAAHLSILELHEKFDETVHLMVLKGPRVKFIDGAESAQMLRVGLRIGNYMPAFCSAGGKALLSQLSPTDVDRTHRGGLPAWPRARLKSLTALKRHLAATRARGYGVNWEETEQGVCGVGACIRDQNGVPVGALALAIPSSRFRRTDIPTFGDAVVAAAALASIQAEPSP